MDPEDDQDAVGDEVAQDAVHGQAVTGVEEDAVLSGSDPSMLSPRNVTASAGTGVDRDAGLAGSALLHAGGANAVVDDAERERKIVSAPAAPAGSSASISPPAARSRW